MGETVHDFTADRHRMRVGGQMLAQDEALRLHFGAKSLDSGWSPRILRQPLLALCNAAIASQQTFDAAMVTVYGAWWTGYLAACDAAGVTGLDRPEAIARAHYQQAPDLPIP